MKTATPNERYEWIDGWMSDTEKKEKKNARCRYSIKGFALAIYIFFFSLFSIYLVYTTGFSVRHNESLAWHNSFYFLCYGTSTTTTATGIGWWWWWRRPNKMLMSVGNFSQFNVWNVYFLFAFCLLLLFSVRSNFFFFFRFDSTSCFVCPFTLLESMCAFFSYFHLVITV